MHEMHFLTEFLFVIYASMNALDDHFQSKYYCLLYSLNV